MVFFSFTTTNCIVLIIATQPCHKFVQHRICHSILKHVVNAAIFHGLTVNIMVSNF